MECDEINLSYEDMTGFVFNSKLKLSIDNKRAIQLLKGKIEYSITDKKIVKCKVRGTIKGTGIDLEDDSSISFYQNMDMICKTKLK